jgi:adenine-specific DNA-methyltransferase
MAAIHDLIAQVADERLRERLAAEWARAPRERKLGLVFEEHLSELLPLPEARPRKGHPVAPCSGSLEDLPRVRGVRGGRLQGVRPQAGSNAGLARVVAAAHPQAAQLDAPFRRS